MLRRTLIYAAAALLFLLGMRFATTLQAHQEKPASALAVNSTPKARHAGSASGLAPTLPATDFPDNPVAQHAYATAAKIEPLLNQLPSECGQSQAGEATLLNCFQDRQASQCKACQKEDFFAYTESREGDSTRHIRKKILQGAWKRVHLSSWKTPLVVKIAALHLTRAHAAPFTTQLTNQCSAQLSVLFSALFSRRSARPKRAYKTLPRDHLPASARPQVHGIPS